MRSAPTPSTSACARQRGAAPCDSACQSRSEPTTSCVRRYAQASPAGCAQPGPAPTCPTWPPAGTRTSCTPIGIAAEHGVIVDRLQSAIDFPSDTHRLLLNVAANQATLALLTEHRAR